MKEGGSVKQHLRWVDIIKDQLAFNNPFEGYSPNPNNG